MYICTYLYSIIYLYSGNVHIYILALNYTNTQACTYFIHLYSIIVTLKHVITCTYFYSIILVLKHVIIYELILNYTYTQAMHICICLSVSIICNESNMNYSAYCTYKYHINFELLKFFKI